MSTDVVGTAVPLRFAGVDVLVEVTPVALLAIGLPQAASTIRQLALLAASVEPAVFAHAVRQVVDEESLIRLNEMLDQAN